MNNLFGFHYLNIKRVFFFTLLLCFSCNTHKEKDKILNYYSRITEWTKSAEYKEIYNKFDPLSRKYRQIANECGFDSDDLITRIVSAHYDNDPDVMRARSEWISVKKKIDSDITGFKPDSTKISGTTKE